MIYIFAQQIFTEHMASTKMKLSLKEETGKQYSSITHDNH